MVGIIIAIIMVIYNNSSIQNNASYHQKWNNGELKSKKGKGGRVTFKIFTIYAIGEGRQELVMYLSYVQTSCLASSSIFLKRVERCWGKYCLSKWWFQWWPYWHKTFERIRTKAPNVHNLFIIIRISKLEYLF